LTASSTVAILVIGGRLNDAPGVGHEGYHDDGASSLRAKTSARAEAFTTVDVVAADDTRGWVAATIEAAAESQVVPAALVVHHVQAVRR
jgi:hypothetical protein